MKFNRLMLAICATVFIGCSSSRIAFENISLGMSKEEVRQKLGNPISTAAQGRTEYYIYNSKPAGRIAPFPGEKWDDYYVRFVDGSVESFGKNGDFDSTKTPTLRIETNERKDIHIKDSGDLYTELKKLKELKDSGIITEDEFASRKREILKKY